ncbi:aldo/keto reductase [Amycolatopsis sp. K13G38]|uniref:Aldo/keto reductase n=1 Tax=Amycolatopsis acididurans TaxID=2724524 RepID=A0ABX1JE18_9PSEU|nr:aldo/keto reductase [Amycolatopsis acididurans]NKQ58032.1 aldo/keto reductase [Amycolatopsis acididurans]
MEHRRLGNTGFRVSALGLGGNAFGGRADARSARNILDRALAAGITLVDTADSYAGQESERILGEALTGRRDQVVLASKGGSQVGAGPNDHGATRHHLIAALDGSLRRLRTDYLDLYTVHFADPETGDEETLSALEAMVSAGKVRYVCASNYPAWRVCRALWTSDRRGLVRFQAVQASYSLVDRTVELETQPLCLDQGVGIIAFWPLGGGLLSGKYAPGENPPPGSRALTQPIFRRSFTPQRLELARELRCIAEQRGETPGALALAWVLRRPGISSVLVGATRVEQLEQNLRCLAVEFDDELMEQLDSLSAASRWTPFR